MLQLLILVPSALSLVAASPLQPRTGGDALQAPFSIEDRSTAAATELASPKKLHGQFLHITDIHPDPWYVPKGRLSTSCHRKKPRREREKAGFWGTPYTESCDSPDSLVNLTMNWLDEEWADKLDFVIWTGDSARHDIDHEIPRTAEEIFTLNRRTTAQMESVFHNSKRKVPIVVSLAHNIMYPGPNEVTHEYADIWKNIVPFDETSVFLRGAYYAKEIIPNQLGKTVQCQPLILLKADNRHHVAVISLNTLYFYDSNKAVDGCPEKKGTDDPGRLQLNWLEVQLRQFRKRKMQVWIIGHVPPTMGNYYPECYLGYGQLALRFQDTIVGHIFGHMNVDHFFWIDAHELHHGVSDPSLLSQLWDKITSFSWSTTAKKRYSLAKTLRKDFRSLPPHRSKDNETEAINYDDYAVVNVGPAIVPAYLPSVRVFTYNVTHWTPSNGVVGEDEELFKEEASPEDEDEDEDDDDDDDDDDDEEDVESEPDKKKKGSKRHHGHRHDPDKIDCTLKKNRDREECIFKKPRHASKRSPSRRNRLWTPLGYTQWYLPDLDNSNKSHPPRFEVEYMTYPLSSLVPATDYPVPQRLLPDPLKNMSSIPKDMTSRYTPYELKDLTISSWIKLARRLGRKKKLFRRFVSFMYLGGEED
ncbi:Endopolyphosphatase [Tulasnella sp. 425]|nr:Endopolyphosphatase [Tulasnella sp. 425]